MKNFVQEGNVITVKLTADAMSGEIVVVGKIVGVATTSGVIGDEVEVALTGVYMFPIVKATVIIAGDPAYITSAGALVKTATGNDYVGVFVTASPATSDECQVNLV